MIYIGWMFLAIIKLLELANISWLMVFILPFSPYILLGLLMIASFLLSDFFKYLAKKVDDNK